MLAVRFIIQVRFEQYVNTPTRPGWMWNANTLW